VDEEEGEAEVGYEQDEDGEEGKLWFLTAEGEVEHDEGEEEQNGGDNDVAENYQPDAKRAKTEWPV
jgi:hypothetical protein